MNDGYLQSKENTDSEHTNDASIRYGGRVYNLDINVFNACMKHRRDVEQYFWDNFRLNNVTYNKEDLEK